MVKTQKWEDALFKAVAEREKITYLGSKHPDNLRLFEQPNWEVWEMTPNQRLDADRRYLLAGPQWSIMLQSSIIKTLHDLLGDRLGYLLTFEEFWEIWEKGGNKFINRTGTRGLQSNFPRTDRRNPDGSVTPAWRKNVETRPGFQEWKNPNDKANPKIRVIEYWPERSAKLDSYLLMGSDRDIIYWMMAIEYLGGEVVADVGRGDRGVFRCKNQPKVTLYFLEDKQDVEPGWDAIDGEVSFRIMDKTSDPDSNLPQIDVQDLKDLAKKIHEIFVKPNQGKGLVWRKGVEQVSYHDWPMGYRFWVLCRNSNEGKNIVEKVLQIQGHYLKLHKLNKSENFDPATAYPTVPPSEQVLGQLVRQPRRRAVADVRFQSARIEMPNWKHPIILVNKGEVAPIP